MRAERERVCGKAELQGDMRDADAFPLTARRIQGEVGPGVRGTGRGTGSQTWGGQRASSV